METDLNDLGLPSYFVAIVMGSGQMPGEVLTTFIDNKESAHEELKRIRSTTKEPVGLFVAQRME